MTNPFTNLLAKLKEEKQKNIERQINDSVYVSNDPNDPDNGIYVFCNGVPVSKVTNTKGVEGCYVSINDVGDMLKDIKKMYANYLNNNPINTKENGKENDSLQRL